MKMFNEIDPLTIQSNSNVVGSMVDSENSNRTYYLLVEDDYVILASLKLHTFPATGKQEWFRYQLEIPKSGIPWIISTLENKFFKLSHEGGLPADVRHYEEVVDGEKLGIARASNLGSDGFREGGYSFVTMSRSELGRTMGKRMNFTDSFLFKHGFFDLLKTTAQKIERGEL